MTAKIKKWGPSVWDEKAGMFIQKLIGEYTNYAPQDSSEPLRMRTGCTQRHLSIYFIQIENSDGFIKVGLARFPAARLAALQTGNPYKLKLLGVVSRVTEAFETRLHTHFQQFKVRGEWFKPVPELLDFIKQETTWHV